MRKAGTRLQDKHDLFSYAAKHALARLLDDGRSDYVVHDAIDRLCARSRRRPCVSVDHGGR